MEQAATAVQLSFEESVIESYNLYEMATKGDKDFIFFFFAIAPWNFTDSNHFFAGYVSFVRSYAALPKDVRDVFNFQSLHLGHYAKSFALRDPPARINSAGRIGQRNDRTQQFNTARQRNPAAKRAALAAG